MSPLAQSIRSSFAYLQWKCCLSPRLGGRSDHNNKAVPVKGASMTRLEHLTDLVENPISRRQFAKNVGLTGAGIAATSVLASTVVGPFITEAQATTTITDNDILNFALNLEYLEAEFYTCAVTGQTITQSGIIPGSASTGPTTGCQKVNFSATAEVNAIAHQIMHDEQQHVIFLRAALGAAAVKKPTINLDALGFGFENPTAFLKLARDFEDVGVSAYGGAAPLIQSHAVLAAAARIALTEAYHAGTVRTKMILQGIQEPPIDGKDIPPTESHFFPVTSKGLAIVRSASEVLHIVYAGGTCSGGFFPDGFNGKIKCAS